MKRQQIILKRDKLDVMNSINIMLTYYDKFMVESNFNKQLSREQLFEMFHEYYEWLQGKS
jgi:hypothetical protein